MFLGAGVQVGNEFSSVEALWSQFENVMGRDGEGEAAEEGMEEKDGQQGANDDDQVGGDDPAAVHTDAKGRS